EPPARAATSPRDGNGIDFGRRDSPRRLSGTRRLGHRQLGGLHAALSCLRGAGCPSHRILIIERGPIIGKADRPGILYSRRAAGESRVIGSARLPPSVLGGSEASAMRSWGVRGWGDETLALTRTYPGLRAPPPCCAAA